MSQSLYLPPNLSNGSVLSEYVVEVFIGDLVRQIPDEKDPVNFWRESDLEMIK